MNCPSRTDDDGLNPGWNQNPPHFASDLTTCQDMKGIANHRELRHGDGYRSGKGCSGCGDKGEGHMRLHEQRYVIGAERSPKRPCAHWYENSTARIADQAWMKRPNIQSMSSTPSSTWMGWMIWMLSVLLTSILISNANASGMFGGVFWIGSLFGPATVSKTNALQRTDNFTKRGSCAAGKANKSYNVPFHVGGLFIILFVSTTACAFPILVIKFPRLRIPISFLFSAKHFGTGVLIATAFVHLLPTAFISLGNPCLSGFWTTDYPAMPGAIALVSIFFVTIVEMIFSPAQHACGGGSEGVNAISRTQHDQGSKTPNGPDMVQSNPPDSSQMRNLGPLQGRKTSISRTLSRMEEGNQKRDELETATQREQDIDVDGRNELAIVDGGLTPDQAQKKAILQCLLLEMGILFHSIFIGMSLSVSVGSEFVILLIAIIFHQTFEGLALGVRIATIQWPKNATQPWLMAFAYGCTTPLGQAIGIATHNLYTPDSEIGLLIIGVMNAISAGLLVFASLVELLSEDFLSDESWQVLKGKRRVHACVLVFSGAFLMSLVGAWA